MRKIDKVKYDIGQKVYIVERYADEPTECTIAEIRISAFREGILAQYYVDFQRTNRKWGDEATSIEDKRECKQESDLYPSKSAAIAKTLMDREKDLREFTKRCDIEGLKGKLEEALKEEGKE